MNEQYFNQQENNHIYRQQKNRDEQTIFKINEKKNKKYNLMHSFLECENKDDNKFRNNKQIVLNQIISEAVWYDTCRSSLNAMFQSPHMTLEPFSTLRNNEKINNGVTNKSSSVKSIISSTELQTNNEIEKNDPNDILADILSENINSYLNSNYTTWLYTPGNCDIVIMESMKQLLNEHWKWIP